MPSVGRNSYDPLIITLVRCEKSFIILVILSYQNLLKIELDFSDLLDEDRLQLLQTWLLQDENN